MAGKMVMVGCKLPNGIILEHPMKPGVTVEIAGKNKSNIIGATHMTTAVDEEFWSAWSAVHKDFPALKSGALFAAKNEAEVKAIVIERKDDLTGFEPMRTDGKDKRAKGVKSRTEKEDE